MQSVPLSEEEIKTIKDARNQVLVSFSTIGLIVAILTGIFLGIIYKSNAFAESTNIVFAGLLILIISTFIFFLFKGIQYHNLDLKLGTKEVFQVIIDQKNTHTNWGWHGNPIADITSKSPKHIEYFILSGDDKYFIDEEVYNLVNAGETVEISLSHHTEIILSVKKNSSV